MYGSINLFSVKILECQILRLVTYIRPLIIITNKVKMVELRRIKYKQKGTRKRSSRTISSRQILYSQIFCWTHSRCCQVFRTWARNCIFRELVGRIYFILVATTEAMITQRCVVQTWTRIHQTPNELTESGDQDSWRETKMLTSAHVRRCMQLGSRIWVGRCCRHFIYYYGRF